MCGVVGIGFLGDLSRDEEVQRQEIAQFFLMELLIETQSRGPDATGASVVFDNGQYVGLKNAIPAVEFVSKTGKKETEFAGFINTWTDMIKKKAHKDAKIVLGHCRKSSVGGKHDNNNNHPIHIDPVLGVHNGTLKNDDVIFKKLDCGRDGQVDSEAIMRLMYKNTDGGKEPFTMDMLKNTANKLEGTFTCLISNSNNPYQMAFFREGREMEMFLIKKLNMIIVVSEESFMKKALFRYKKMVEILPKMFSQSVNISWPVLEKGDYHQKKIVDKEYGIIDLTKTVDKNNDRVDDFIIRAHMPTIDKEWEEPVATVHNNYNRNTNTNTTNNNTNTQTQTNTGTTKNTTHNPTKAAEIKESRKATTVGAQTSSGKKKEQNIVGKIWVSKLKKYQNITAEEVENVTGDCGHMEITSIDDDETAVTEKNVVVPERPTGLKKFNLKKVELLSTDTYNKHPLEIEEVKLTNTRTATKEEIEKEINNLPVVAVNVSKDPVALEATNKYIKDTQTYTKDDIDDIAVDLELGSGSAIEELDRIPLINRAKKRFLKTGFYDGFVCGMKHVEVNIPEEKTKYLDGIEIKKGKKKDRLISAYKFITQVQSIVIEQQNEESSPGQRKLIGSVEDFISSVIMQKELKISVDEFDRMFSKYEVDNSITLKSFQNVLCNLEGTGESENAT